MSEYEQPQGSALVVIKTEFEVDVKGMTHRELWSEVKKTRVENGRGKESKKNEATNRSITYHFFFIW